MRPDPNAQPISHDEYAAELEARTRRWEAGKLAQQQGCELEGARRIDPADYTPRWDAQTAADEVNRVAVVFAVPKHSRAERKRRGLPEPKRGSAIRTPSTTKPKAADTARPVVADATGQVLMFSEGVR